MFLIFLLITYLCLWIQVNLSAKDFTHNIIWTFRVLLKKLAIKHFLWLDHVYGTVFLFRSGTLNQLIFLKSILRPICIHYSCSYINATILYCIFVFLICFVHVLSRGGVVTKNLGRYVPRGLSKIGSPELIFWLKSGVSRTNFCKNFVLRSLKFAKIGLEMQDFSKNASGVSGAGKRLEKVGLRS